MIGTHFCISYKDTYSYIPHEDKRDVDEKEKEIIITENVFLFIGKLVNHIPENSSHCIRYYGFYSNKSNTTKKVKEEKGSYLKNYIIIKEKRELSFRRKIIKSFDFDPLLCSRCGKQMTLNVEMCFIPDNIKRRVKVREYG